MIDYFAHVSALRACLAAIQSAPPTDPAAPLAVSAALADAHHEPGAAILGALVDHLLQYSEAKTSKEIGILSQAAALFKNALSIMAQIEAARASLEAGLTTPTAPGVLAAYNTALTALPNIATAVQNLQVQLQTFQTNFSGNWMLPVGQEQGASVAQWAWRDVFLARRTTAFVASAQASATTTRQKAFAIGALGGAVGNLFGSAYLNTVVRGPRRSHELRHRLAAYSVGAWLRDNEPQYAGSLTAIRNALTFGQQGTPALPADIKTLAEATLGQAYPAGTAALPNLDEGYKNLMQHLSLLGDFTLPPVPPPMNNTLTGAVLKTQDLILGDDNIHPGGSGLGTNNPGIGAHESAGAVCGELLLWLIWPPQWVAALDNALSGGGSSGSPGVTAARLETISQSPAALGAINRVYGMSFSFWKALAAGRFALVLRGLLYPDSDDLSNPTFTQFLSVPPASSSYPLLPMPSSDDGTSWPTSAVETPATLAASFSTGASPLTFLTGPDFSVAAASPTLWVGMIEVPGSGKLATEWSPQLKIDWTANFNLDSDRGFLAPCWALGSGSAITNPPVVTNTLSYTAI